jgi:hypothetical protein
MVGKTVRLRPLQRHTDSAGAAILMDRLYRVNAHTEAGLHLLAKGVPYGFVLPWDHIREFDELMDDQVDGSLKLKMVVHSKGDNLWTDTI